MDCYGDPKVTGKVGTDIEESKCSWLIVQALKRANADQRKTLEVSKNDKIKEIDFKIIIIIGRLW